MTDTTQSKYRKRVKTDEDQPVIEENEVRIKGNFGNVKRYVDYAYRLLEGIPEPSKKFDTSGGGGGGNNNDNDNDNDGKEEIDSQQVKKKVKKFDTIMLKATGRAINKAVTTAEVVKRRVANLHQITSLETLAIVDVWEPLEEGLEEVETTRRVASITITLSRDPNVDKSNPGYQIPLHSIGIQPNFGGNIDNRSFRGRNNRGRMRGNRGRGGGNRRRNNRRRGGQYQGNRSSPRQGGNQGMNMGSGSPGGGQGRRGSPQRDSPHNNRRNQPRYGNQGRGGGGQGNQNYNQGRPNQGRDNQGRQNQGRPSSGGYQGGNQYQRGRGYYHQGGDQRNRRM